MTVDLPEHPPSLGIIRAEVAICVYVCLQWFVMVYVCAIISWCGFRIHLCIHLGMYKFVGGTDIQTHKHPLPQQWLFQTKM